MYQQVPKIEEPNWLKPIFKNIPEELKQLPWAVWKSEPRLNDDGKHTGKWSKAPRNPTTGKMVGTNQPEKFGTYEEAVKAYETGNYTGVGILLVGNGIVGFDIDDVNSLVVHNQDLKKWVSSAIQNSVYCEASPSNTGLRLFALGKLSVSGQKHNGLEIYADVRFLTITGHIICQRVASK